jgi:hypothetical protein
VRAHAEASVWACGALTRTRAGASVQAHAVPGQALGVERCARRPGPALCC